MFHSRGFPPRLASVVKEAKERMAEIHSNGFLAELAPTNVNEKGTGISVLVQDQNGCIQSRQRFLHQLGDIPVQYQSTALQKGNVKDCGTKQIVLSLSKQYTDKQGWEAAKLAPRVAARRWLQHRAGVKLFDVRPPTRIVGREELRVVAQIVSSTYDGLRASGTDSVMTRPFCTTEEETTHFRSVPLPPDFSRQRKKNPILDGLQQYGEWCHGEACTSITQWCKQVGMLSRCSSNAFFFGGRRMFSLDTCAASVATQRTHVQALMMLFL